METLVSIKEKYTATDVCRCRLIRNSVKEDFNTALPLILARLVELRDEKDLNRYRGLCDCVHTVAHTVQPNDDYARLNLERELFITLELHYLQMFGINVRENAVKWWFGGIRILDDNLIQAVPTDVFYQVRIDFIETILKLYSKNNMEAIKLHALQRAFSTSRKAKKLKRFDWIDNPRSIGVNVLLEVIDWVITDLESDNRREGMCFRIENACRNVIHMPKNYNIYEMKEFIIDVLSIHYGQMYGIQHGMSEFWFRELPKSVNGIKLVTVSEQGKTLFCSLRINFLKAVYKLYDKD